MSFNEGDQATSIQTYTIQLHTLHQQTLEQIQSAKYLGLTITDDPDWGQHISEITCKATKTLGFLRRNLALAPRHGPYLLTLNNDDKTRFVV